MATTFGKVSSHYLVDTDGTILRLVDERDRGHHADVSSWFSMHDLNSAAIGIEITNSGFEPFSERRIDSVLVILKSIKERYKMPARNFIGHMDIAPGRKVDPNKYFPWKRLAAEGYGLWYDEDKAKQMSEDPTAVASLRDSMINFVLLGYGVKKPEITIEAFKSRYTVADKSGKLSDYDKHVLRLLADQVMEDAQKE
ncbi:MAG: N-acetylmuramoyl-L-alanine amidase [Prevotellaceae bacterium]|nr:N-acetylmuramoyl-L-alanine amidase [Prevotellaceae bacterium]